MRSRMDGQAGVINRSLTDLSANRGSPVEARTAIMQVPTRSAGFASRAATAIVGLIYVVAWFVQVAKDGQTLADGVLPGWQAVVLAFSPLWGDFNGNGLRAALCVGSGLTNVVFLAGILRLARRSRTSTTAWVWLLLGSAAVNTFWIVDGGSPGDMRAGYWLWLASFLLLGVVAFLSRAAEPSAARP